MDEILEDEDNDESLVQGQIIPWELRAILLFVLTWQFSYGVSDAGVLGILLFMYNFFRLISAKYDGGIMQTICDLFPKTLKTAFHLVGINPNAFTRYIVCPKCDSVFDYNSGYTIEGESKCPKRCPYVSIPHHPHASRRTPCGAFLMKSGRGRSGNIILEPYKTFAYQSLKVAISNLVNRRGFLEQCEHWRARCATLPDGLLGDIYDAQIWKNFMTVDGMNFSGSKFNICLGLNVDWFQPFTCTRKFIHSCSIYIPEGYDLL